jgi:hypothetical protein
MPTPDDCTRQAIAVMTVWLDEDNSVNPLATAMIAEAAGGGWDKASDMIAGFINLTGALLLRLEEVELPEPITTTWSFAAVQACILHLIRNTFRYA